jgi:pimeloyl-ACP methyl ester carboxylesterase
MHRLLIEGQPRAALLAERPAAAAMIEYAASDAYLRNLAALNLQALWEPLDLPVLVVYGSADFITGEADSRAILEDVNRTHPGRGEFRIIDHMDHYLTDAADQATSIKDPRVWDPTPARHPAYQAAIEPVVGDWLVAQAGHSG